MDKDNLVIKLVVPVKFIPFRNFKGKNIKGLKSHNQKATKKKRNVILKINSNRIV